MSSTEREIEFAIVFDNDLSSEQGNSSASIWIESSFPERETLRGELLLLSSFTLRQMLNYGLNDPMADYVGRSILAIPTIFSTDSGGFSWSGNVVPPYSLISADERRRRNLALGGSVHRAEEVEQDRPRFEGRLRSEGTGDTSSCSLEVWPKRLGFLKRKAPNYAHLAVQHLYAWIVAKNAIAVYPDSRWEGASVYEFDWLRLDIIRGVVKRCEAVRTSGTLTHAILPHLSAAIVHYAFVERSLGEDEAQALEANLEHLAWPHDSESYSEAHWEDEDLWGEEEDPSEEEDELEPEVLQSKEELSAALQSFQSYYEALESAAECHAKGETGMAFQHYNAAYSVALEYGDPGAAAGALAAMGGIALEIGEQSVAQSCLEQAVEAYWALGNRDEFTARWPVLAHITLGRIYWAQENYEKAHRAFLDAHQIGKAHGFDEDVAVAQSWLTGIPESD